MFGFGLDIGVDLGTATILIFVKNRGVVLNEPSVVAVERDTGKILAIGEEARRMIGRTPGNIVAIRPLREGVIADFDTTEKMLRYFLAKAGARKTFFRPRIMVCVPAGVTMVEKRAVIEAASQAAARQVYLIEEPLAAALGVGIDISKPSGAMVVDIGGGTTDIAVLSLGGIVLSDSIRVAGDKFDEAMVRYLRRESNLLIGERTAEEIKIQIGTAHPADEERSMEVRGRDMVTGLPRSIVMNSRESLEALREPLGAILNTIRNVLERTPPELAADIIDKGIVLTGGGCLLEGLDRYLVSELQIPVNRAEDPVACVAVGTGRALQSLDILEPHLLSNRRKS
ncbi:MAG: rod shape-determining protein MreB [Firmicutes bacterium]|nr:rod shape-determining protein MreB [Bacillota bacterium]